jgi:hypothetical protein
LYHPRIGELKKFACDKRGITEININLLSKNKHKLPEEIVKIAANNLGYVANHLKVNIPDNLKIYQTGEWKSPRIDVTHLNKAAFYKKIQDQNNKTFKEKNNITKTAESINKYDKNNFSDELIPNLKARIKLTHNEKIANLYEEILEKYSEYTPEQVVTIIKKADSMCNMEKAIKRGILKTAEDSTYNLIKTSWLAKLKEKNLPYLTNMEKEALLSKDGEAVFNSLPKPTKDRIIKDLK